MPNYSNEKIVKNMLQSLFVKKEYDKIIDSIENHLDNDKYRDDLFIQKLLGFSYLYQGHIDQGIRILKPLSQDFPKDVELLNVKAYSLFQEGKKEEGITTLLDAIYLDENNKKLKKNLASIKNVENPKVYFSMHKIEDYLFFTPEHLSFFFKFSLIFQNKVFWILFSLFIIACLIISSFYYYPSIKNGLSNINLRRGFNVDILDKTTINDLDNLIESRKQYEKNGSYIVHLTEDEIERNLNIIQAELRNNNRNKALMAINEILYSNAPEQIKEKVTILTSFVPLPDTKYIDFVPNISDVIKAPFLYEENFVNWKGTVVNLHHNKRESTSFDLLVNFLDQAVVEGILEVHVTGFAKIENGDQINVYGLIKGINEDNKILLKAEEIVPLNKK